MFLKSSAIFSILTFVSRIFGFVRDLLIAAFFGTTLYADAFNVAFKLPNLFRNLFAEGAFSAAFVPLFSGKLSAEGKEKALKFAMQILYILTFCLLLIIALIEVFTPFVMLGIAPGFEADNYKFNLTIYLTKITAPYLFFISIVTFFACILNSIGKFASMAAAPILFNLVMIIGLYYFGNTTDEKVVIAAWSVFIGGVAQLLFIFIPITRKKVWPKFAKISWDKDVRRFFINITPAIFSSGIVQINLWIGTIIATTIPGAVSTIYYVDRLTQLPISLIGVSIGIVILPSLSRHFKLKNTDKMLYTQNRALEFSLLLSLPCTVALITIAKPLIYILFQRGEFSDADTLKSIPALITLAVGLPAYIANKILISSFFASENTKTPLKISLVSMVINIGGSLIMIQYIEHVGITLATAVSAWVNVILLMVFGYKKGIFKFDYTIKMKVLRMLLSSVFLYIVLDASQGMLGIYIYDSSKFIAISVFGGMLLISGAVYLYAIHVTKAYSIKDLKENS